jgi:hypothetical protein
MPEKSHPELEKLAAVMAAELLADGEYLYIITKKNKHTGTWLKSSLTQKLSVLLHQHIEISEPSTLNESKT